MSPKNDPGSQKADTARSTPAASAKRRNQQSAARTPSGPAAKKVSRSSGSAPSTGARASALSEGVEVPAGGHKPTVALAGDQATAATDDQKSIVVPFTSWRPGVAIEAAMRHETVTVNLPLVGPVTLPSGPHMAWYAGVATLAVLEIVDWPIAIVMVTAKALSDSSHHQLVSQFGKALEKGV